MQTFFAMLRCVKMVISRRIRVYALYLYRHMWQRRSYWLRLSLAWTIAACFAYFNLNIDADNRFAIRPTQEVSKDIVVVEIEKSFWDKIIQQKSNDYFLREPNPHNDSYFWHEATWEKLLARILKQNPSRIGVNFFFGENSTPPSRSARRKATFGHPKVVWGVKTDMEGQILPSYFAGSYTKSAGLIDINLDSDGIARHMAPVVADVPLLPLQLIRNTYLENESIKELALSQSYLINYRGPADTFEKYTAEEILNGKVPKAAFEDKLVVIGPTETATFMVTTPVGVLSRAEYFANILDNLQYNRWIKNIPLVSLLVFLALLVWFSAWVTSNYPQILAAAVVAMSLFVSVAASYLLFDLFYLHLPQLPVAVALLGTFFIFVSFQLSIRDYENNRLEKEKQFLVNVEELKTNFFSLISHDLKTPIAKIQGICDRMFANNPKPEVEEDIHALKQEARELNRYIKTLLQLTRVDSKDFRVNKEPLDINITIEQVIEIVRPLAKNKNIVLTRELEPMFLIEADPLLMTEVVLNLVENAVKYSPENSEVIISSKEADGRVIVIVEDKGPGIQAEDQKFIFEKFFRGKEGKNHSKGSGLGLYLVKYFIEKHDGFVLLESSETTGTKIGFSVPVQAENNMTEDSNETSA